MGISNRTYVDMILTGSEVSSALSVRLLLLRDMTAYSYNPSSTIKGVDLPAGHNVNVSSCFKLDIQAMIDAKTDWSTNTVKTYNLRFKNSTSNGLDLFVTLKTVSGNHVAEIRGYSVVEGSTWTNTAVSSGMYMIDDDENTTMVNCIASFNGLRNYRYIPCIVNIPSQDSYGFGSCAQYYNTSPASAKVACARLETDELNNKLYPISFIDNNTTSPYPYTSDETEEGGNGSLDDSSDDITEPDDSLTDEINTYLCNGGFLSTYKLSLAQLEMFGYALWDNNIITQIKQCFSNPMDAIVSLQCLPFNVPSSTNRPLKLGGVQLGNATGGVVSSNQVTIDCGSVYLEKYFDNFLDMTNTTIKIFLPFVGTQEIPPQYCQGGEINVKYKVDILTGSFVCWLKYTKDGHTNILNRHSGTMAMQMPVTSGSHANILNSLMSITSVGAVTLASGGLGAGAIMAGLTSIGVGAMSATANAMQKSYSDHGNYGSNIGFMDNRTPYLIIERPVTVTPSQYAEEEGFPSFITATLSTLSGYTEVQTWQPNSIAGMTKEEMRICEEQLKNGVIF